MLTNTRTIIITLALILMSATALSAGPSNYIFFAETPDEIACSKLFLQEYAEPSNYIFFAETPLEISCSRSFLQHHAAAPSDVRTAISQLDSLNVDNLPCNPALSPDPAG